MAEPTLSMSDQQTAARMAARLTSHYDLTYAERGAMAQELVRLSQQNAALVASQRAVGSAAADAPKEHPVLTQYKDLIFAMQGAWGLVHGSGDDALKAKWLALIQENGDFAKAPPVISTENNMRLYEALSEGRDVVMGAWTSNALRGRYDRVLAAHASLAPAPEGFVLAFPGGSDAEADELVHSLRLGGTLVYRVPGAEAGPVLKHTLDAAGVEPEIGG